MDQVILVNELDVEVGFADKIDAHKQALLHRAFSVFIFNSKGKMLLQKRAFDKYHSAGLWTNACCSHPKPGEELVIAAKRRLSEEMGINVVLEKAFDFIYKTEFNNGLTEYEFDHVLIGKSDSEIKPCTKEVADYCFKKIEEVEVELELHPQKYTEWFKIAFPKVKQVYKSKEVDKNCSLVRNRT